jgi:hypothetical protein
LLPSHFFFYYFCYKQGDGNKLVIIAHFLFLLLEEKKAMPAGLLPLPFFSFVHVATKKAMATIVAFFK